MTLNNATPPRTRLSGRSVKFLKPDLDAWLDRVRALGGPFHIVRRMEWAERYQDARPDIQAIDWDSSFRLHLAFGEDPPRQYRAELDGRMRWVTEIRYPAFFFDGGFGTYLYEPYPGLNPALVGLETVCGMGISGHWVDGDEVGKAMARRGLAAVAKVARNDGIFAGFPDPDWADVVERSDYPANRYWVGKHARDWVAADPHRAYGYARCIDDLRGDATKARGWVLLPPDLFASRDYLTPKHLEKALAANARDRAKPRIRP